MEPLVASKSGPDGTQHSEQLHVAVSMVQLSVHTALAMSVYTKMPCKVAFGEVLHKVCLHLRLYLQECTHEARSWVGAHWSTLYPVQ